MIDGSYPITKVADVDEPDVRVIITDIVPHRITLTTPRRYQIPCISKQSPPLLAPSHNLVPGTSNISLIKSLTYVIYLPIKYEV